MDPVLAIQQVNRLTAVAKYFDLIILILLTLVATQSPLINPLPNPLIDNNNPIATG